MATTAPELTRALCVALRPWNYELESLPLQLGNQLSRASRAARKAATKHDLALVVWLTVEESSAILWVYDREREDVTAREVPSPPYDSGTAAAIALSLKTSIRSPRLTEAPPPPAPVSPPAPSPVVAPTMAAPDSAKPRPQPTASNEKEPARMLLSAAVRGGALADVDLDVTYGMELRWSLAQVGVGGWLGASGRANVPRRLESEAFEGTFVEYRLGVAAGWLWQLTTGWQAGVRIGLGGRYTTVSGDVLVEGELERPTRLRGFGAAGAELAWELGGQRVVLQASAFATPNLEGKGGGVLRGQSYLAETTQVTRLLQVNPAWGELSLGWSVPLP